MTSQPLPSPANQIVEEPNQIVEEASGSGFAPEPERSGDSPATQYAETPWLEDTSEL